MLWRWFNKNSVQYFLSFNVFVEYDTHRDSFIKKKKKNISIFFKVVFMIGAILTIKIYHAYSDCQWFYCNEKKKTKNRNCFFKYRIFQKYKTTTNLYLRSRVIIESVASCTSSKHVCLISVCLCLALHAVGTTHHRPMTNYKPLVRHLCSL